MKLFCRELADIFRFFLKTPAEEKKIVFYAEHEGYYAAFDGLIKTLLEEHGQSLCYVTSDPNDPILETPRREINAFYVNKLLPLFMGIVNCRAMVMTMPDLNQFHIKRSINDVHYVYVFHAIVSTHMVYRYGAFDHYDSILCVGPHHVKEIREYEKQNQLSPKTLVKAGYHRLEQIYNAYQRLAAEGRPSTSKPTILIAPSWAPHNILESCVMPLIENLLQADYGVIVRPHPEAKKHAPELIESLAKKFADHPKVTIEQSVAQYDALLRADVLITDWSGIAHEYAFGTERPVLFIDLSRKVNNDRYEQLGIEPMEVSVRSQIGRILSPSELEKAVSTIDQLIAEQTMYKERIANLRSQYVYAFGRSAEVGARHILNVVEPNVSKPDKSRTASHASK